MSIALATRGIISGFMGPGGSTGDIIYVDFPMCNTGPEAEKVGRLSFTASDPNTVSVIPNPMIGMEILPRRRSDTLILPTKNIYSAFPTPGE